MPIYLIFAHKMKALPNNTVEHNLQLVGQFATGLFSFWIPGGGHSVSHLDIRFDPALMSGCKKRRPVDVWAKLLSSKSFRERLGLSKYACWARDLKEEELLGVLWAVGEYGYRADEVLEIFRRHGSQYSVSLVRATVGLEILAEFARDRPSREEQVTQRVRDAVAGAQRLDYLHNVCARRWTIKKLEAIRESDGEECLFHVLFSAFTQLPPLPASDQQRMGNSLRKLKPRGTSWDLSFLVRWALLGWDSSIAQLPLYFRDVYGVEGLRLALDRLDSDASLSARERTPSSCWFSWWPAAPKCVVSLQRLSFHCYRYICRH